MQFVVNAPALAAPEGAHVSLSDAEREAIAAEVKRDAKRAMKLHAADLKASGTPPAQAAGIRTLASSSPKTLAAIAPRDPLQIAMVDAIEAALDQRSVVQDLIMPGTVSAILGSSGSGKTHVALDLTAAITSPWDWRGLKTSHGSCLYVALEGAHGLRNRVAALRARGLIQSGAPLGIVSAPISLCAGNEGALDIAEAGRRLERETGHVLRMIVIDTLARAMAGGDENSGADMGAAIANLDRIRDITRAAVVVVHHVGKDTTKGARGHSSFRAALDTEIVIDGLSGLRTITITKQRDLPIVPAMSFNLETVELGVDADGRAVTSCIVQHEGLAPTQPRATGANQAKALTALREWSRANPDARSISSHDFVSVMGSQGIGRQRRPEVANYLVAARILTSSVGGYTLDRAML